MKRFLKFQQINLFIMITIIQGRNKFKTKVFIRYQNIIFKSLKTKLLRSLR